MSPAEIAGWAGVPTYRVEQGLARARKLEAAMLASSRQLAVDADLIPVFGPRAFTPGSRCAHRGPIPRRSRYYCPVCHQSGLDHLLLPA